MSLEEVIEINVDGKIVNVHLGSKNKYGIGMLQLLADYYSLSNGNPYEASRMLLKEKNKVVRARQIIESWEMIGLEPVKTKKQTR